MLKRMLILLVVFTLTAYVFPFRFYFGVKEGMIDVRISQFEEVFDLCHSVVQSPFIG